MVNVIDNESRKRANMMPVGIKVVDNKGNAVHTAKTDLDTNYISLEQKWFGSSSNNNGGNTDPDNPDHPSAGADYYAGSLADGEITQRKLEWSGTDDPTQSTKVTFADDPGTKLFGQFDGITILGHIQKTTMTKGVLGAVSDVPINYDPYNVAKDGHFTTTSPYPLYIQAASLPIGLKTDIEITGIGEHLSGKNVKAPILSLTFNADKTLTIDHTAGYDNDGDSYGATGANYQFVVDTIATFSKQAAMSQLPPSVNLFSGSASGDIVTVGPSEFYENVMDGLEITFDDYAENKSVLNELLGSGNYVSAKVNISDLGINKIRIPKENLIIGNEFNFENQIVPNSNKATLYVKDARSTEYGTSPFDHGESFYFDSLDNYGLIVKDLTTINFRANLNIKVMGKDGKTQLGDDITEPKLIPFNMTVSKITTYKD